MSMNIISKLSTTCLLALLMGVSITALGQNGVQAPTAESTPSPGPIDIGSLNGTTYVNEFFGMSLSVPKEWILINGNRVKEITREATKTIIQPNQHKQAEFNASIERSVVMLTLTKLPAGSPNNASFMLIAEKPPSPEIKTGLDVINLMKNAFKDSNASIEFQGEPQTQRIGGANFAFVVLKNTSPIGSFMQKIYITVKNGHALEFFYTYLPDGDPAPLDFIMKSVKLD